MKEIARPFCGLNAFLPTPTIANGETIDVARLRSLIDEMIAAGVNAGSPWWRWPTICRECKLNR